MSGSNSRQGDVQPSAGAIEHPAADDQLHDVHFPGIDPATHALGQATYDHGAMDNTRYDEEVWLSQSPSMHARAAIALQP